LIDATGTEPDTVTAMHTIAPEIVRQRLLVEGFYRRDVDEPTIRAFFTSFTAALALRTYDAPVIFAPRGAGKDDNEGYDAFVPLIDSGISLYVWTAARFLSCVTFTCKTFDTDVAVNSIRTFFHMEELEHRAF
jgi:hypothetical protein